VSDIDLPEIDDDELASWLVDQRWFASKAREVQVHLLTVLPLVEQPALAVALVEARFASGTHELYQLLIGRRADGSLSLDALAEPDLAGALAGLFATGAELASEHGEIEFHWLEVAGELSPDAPVVPLAAEQSNSSALVDDRFVVKLFRRLEPGANPELEMLRFLGEHGFDGVPTLVGWHELRSDILDATLGVVQGFLPSAEDGWELVLRGLVDGRADALIDLVGELGGVLAELHNALGSDHEDPDFAPEPLLGESLALLAATVDGQIDRAFVGLPEAADQATVEPLLGRGEEVRDALNQLSNGVGGGQLIRHHGDLHLGQTLRTDDRWVIIDFEGEPARSLLDRRRKRSPLRDVAGMLRSFAYAASAAGIQHHATVPDGWEAAVRDAFLTAYFASVNPELVPSGAAAEKLLALFELEKAVYELEYELNHRPGWMAIPVAGIVRLLDETTP
jgi:trehalose synthase-fused probable maltokinase